MRRALLGSLLLMASLTACGSATKDDNKDGVADGVYKPTDVSVIAPAATHGTISGQVIDGSGAPLNGATVKAAVGSGVLTATTDASGAFAFKDLPGGVNVGVTVSKDGYTTGYGAASVPNSAGNVPANDGNGYVGPVRLFQTNGKLTVSVVGYDGKLVPATGVVQVTPGYGLTPAYAGSEQLLGSVVSHATAANGALTFSNVPQMSELARLGSNTAQVSIAIDPMDTNGDGRFEYGGATLYLSATQIVSSPGLLQVVLPDANQGSGALALVASSCGSLVHGAGSPTDSLVGATDKVYFAFNQPVRADSVAVTVTGDDGKPVGVLVEPGATPSLFDFVPEAGFAPGHGYQVTVNAIATDSRPQVQKTFGGSCYVAPSASASKPGVAHAYFTPDANGRLSPFGSIKLELDSLVGVEGGTPTVAAYVDAELDNPPDSKRASPGEYDLTGNNTAGGFLAQPDPSKPVLGGFTRYFVLTYTGGATLNSLKPVYVVVNDPRTSGTGRLEWVNGIPLTGTAMSLGSAQMQPEPSP